MKTFPAPARMASRTLYLSCCTPGRHCRLGRLHVRRPVAVSKFHEGWMRPVPPPTRSRGRTKPERRLVIRFASLSLSSPCETPSACSGSKPLRTSCLHTSLSSSFAGSPTSLRMTSAEVLGQPFGVKFLILFESSSCRLLIAMGAHLPLFLGSAPPGVGGKDLVVSSTWLLSSRFAAPPKSSVWIWLKLLMLMRSASGFKRLPSGPRAEPMCSMNSRWHARASSVALASMPRSSSRSTPTPTSSRSARATA
mmetsp:Transcript_96697/g.273866  ORF Transcript_96697/g.273866 Transcript_96697/m.273866 type:complete len:251 (+) Transcript_96697:648-1400(+)